MRGATIKEIWQLTFEFYKTKRIYCLAEGLLASENVKNEFRCEVDARMH